MSRRDDVKGGQGRDAEQIAFDALTWFAFAGAAIAIVIAAIATGGAR